MVVTKVSDVSDLLAQARQNPHKSFPAILRLAASEDWKEREVAASLLVEAGKTKPDVIVAEMILWAIIRTKTLKEPQAKV